MKQENKFEIDPNLNTNPLNDEDVPENDNQEEDFDEDMENYESDFEDNNSNDNYGISGVLKAVYSAFLVVFNS